MLIGDVGVGKTTFIRRLLTVDAKEELGDALSIYIDFGSKATLDTEVGRWVVQQIKDQLIRLSQIHLFFARCSLP